MSPAAKEVCVDAGLVLKLVLNEPDSEQAEALFSRWRALGVRLVAPAFCPVEVDSVLRQKAMRPVDAGGLTEEQAEIAFAAVQAIPLAVLVEPGQRQRAWELAKTLELPTVYDAHYLALAELRQCEFWTADERLYRKCALKRLAYVRYLGEAAVISS
ncbi:MAG: type II toxin-antitoxin system VapC family toxin [Moorellales bacterium]